MDHFLTILADASDPDYTNNCLRSCLLALTMGEESDAYLKQVLDVIKHSKAPKSDKISIFKLLNRNVVCSYTPGSPADHRNETPRAYQGRD